MLTPEEVEKVRRAYAKGFEEDQLFRDSAKAWRGNPAHFRAVEKAWSALTKEERLFLGLEIARLTGGDDRTIERVIDWGLAKAARSLVDQPSVPRGRPAMVPGLRAVVRELFCIWVERGGPPEIGNYRREKGGSSLHPYPAQEFVAKGVLQVLPGPYKTTKKDGAQWERLLREVDSQLRSLHK